MVELGQRQAKVPNICQNILCTANLWNDLIIDAKQRSLTQKRVSSRSLCRPLRDLRGVPSTDLRPRPRGRGRRGQRLGTAVAAPEDEALRDVAGAHQVNHRVGYYGKARPTLEPGRSLLCY